MIFFLVVIYIKIGIFCRCKKFGSKVMENCEICLTIWGLSVHFKIDFYMSKGISELKCGE